MGFVVLAMSALVFVTVPRFSPLHEDATWEELASTDAKVAPAHDAKVATVHAHAHDSKAAQKSVTTHLASSKAKTVDKTVDGKSSADKSSADKSSADQKPSAVKSTANAQLAATKAGGKGTKAEVHFLPACLLSCDYIVCHSLFSFALSAPASEPCHQGALSYMLRQGVSLSQDFAC